MTHRVVILTEDLKALRAIAAKGEHRIVSATPEPDRTTQKLSPAEALRIFNTYKGGATAARTAEAHGVSMQTVTRIALNPTHYGVDAEPIRRTIRGK